MSHADNTTASVVTTNLKNSFPFNASDEDTKKNPYREGEVTAAHQQTSINVSTIKGGRERPIIVCNIQWNRNDSRSTADKKILIEESSRELEEGRKKLRSALGILLAPEYFWSRDGEFSEDDLADIYRWLKDLASGYPHIMFIPGTISHSEKITLRNKKKMCALLRETQNCPRNPMFDDKALQVAIRKVVPGHFIVRNTALIAFNTFVNFGSVRKTQVHTYHKCSGYHEVSAERDRSHVYLPGQEKGLFKWHLVERHQAVLNIGLEICLDHCVHTMDMTLAENALRDRYLIDRSGSEQRNIHVILSDFVSTEAVTLQRIVGKTGYFLHSSTMFKSGGADVVTPFTGVPRIDTAGQILETRVDYFQNVLHY